MNTCIIADLNSVWSTIQRSRFSIVLLEKLEFLFYARRLNDQGHIAVLSKYFEVLLDIGPTEF